MSYLDDAHILNGALGPTITAMIAGVGSREAALEWANGGEIPTLEQIRRLSEACDAWQIVALECGPDVARSWMLSPSLELQGQAPLNSLCCRNADAVMRAARTFARNSHQE